MLLISFLFHGFYEKYIVVRLLAAKERHPRSKKFFGQKQPVLKIIPSKLTNNTDTKTEINSCIQ